MDTHALVVSYLFPTLCVFTLLVVYVVGIRPVLRQNPAFKELYAAEDGFLAALASKFSGIKQKLATVFASLVGLLVVCHDAVSELLTQAGLDPQTLGTQILPKVPAYVWPLATMALLWLIQHFRNIADKQARLNAEALLNAGQPLAAPAPGLPVNTLPSPLLAPLSFPDKTEI
jgi:hypothetical protein